MRVLAICSVLLAFCLSATTVFFALRTDSFDGEPYATLAIEHPLLDQGSADATPPPPADDEVAASDSGPAPVQATSDGTPQGARTATAVEPASPAAAATSDANVIAEAASPGTDTAVSEPESDFPGIAIGGIGFNNGTGQQ